MAIIHTFLFDSGFVNSSSFLDPVHKSGGICVPSSRGLSYFVTPQEFVDPRITRATNLNVSMTTKSRLIVDQAEFSQFLIDIQDLWNATERQNFFAIIDQLCFAYNVNATTAQVELALAAWPQYLTASYVLSTTKTVATYYGAIASGPIVCPDYVSFTFVITNGTQYQLRIWVNNAVFLDNYPLSTIGVVVPPLPLADLYTATVTGTAGVFATAFQSSSESQQTLQTYIQSAQYSGYVAQTVAFLDGSGNSTIVQFNLLYNGCTPGQLAIRTAIRALLMNSGVGTTAGWQALAPSLFVTELFYLLPMWEDTTSLITSIIFPNIISIQQAITDATRALFDMSSGFLTSNLDLVAATYNAMTVISIPDTNNDRTRLSLAAEHPTYRAVSSTSIAFDTMTTHTQQFSNLLTAALVLAGGGVVSNASLSTYTPAGDTRTYITFSVGDVEYYVMTKSTYLALVNPT